MTGSPRRQAARAAGLPTGLLTIGGAAGVAFGVGIGLAFGVAFADSPARIVGPNCDADLKDILP